MTIAVEFTHVRLLVDNFAECFRFYEEVLEIPVRFGDPSGPYAEFAAGGAFIGLYQRRLMAEIVGAAARPPRTDVQDSLALTFEVLSVDETYERLRERGVSFVTAPGARPAWHLRSAHFRDPAGNLLEIYEGLPLAETTEVPP
ncbi:MAG: VOC family protein [Dehalococcoidia bacterium]|nr:VOC family protein [Dehalococcoidia bacterium]